MATGKSIGQDNSDSEDRNVESINLNNLQKAMDFKNEGNLLFSKGDFQMCTNLYSKAIDLPGLPREDLAVLYSNRSVAYLNLYDGNMESSTDWRNLALSDAQQALTLRPDWFKTHYRIGCVYKSLGRYSEAVKHFETATGMEPGNYDLKKARDECWLLLNRQESSKEPGSYLEQFRKFNEIHGLPAGDADYLISMENQLKQLNNPSGYIIEGHRYLEGINCEKSCVKAVQCFTKASEMGCAEGKFSLGCLVRDGHGVQQDLELAMRLFKEAAELSSTGVDGLPNAGVASSENAIGQMYEDGIGVPRSYVIAATWYQRASDHGCPVGAYNLGLLYLHGRGLEMNIPRALQNIKLAASRQNTLAMRQLAVYYLNNERDPEQAMAWHRKALEHGDNEAKTHAKEFENHVQALNNDPFKNEVEVFEADHGLSVKNLSSKERVYRKLKTESPGDAMLSQNLEKMDLEDKVPQVAKMNPLFQFNPIMLKERIGRGSKMAERLENAVTHYLEGLLLVFKGEINSDTEKEIIRHFSASLRAEYTVMVWAPDYSEKVARILRKLLSSNIPSDLEVDARVCYAHLHLNSTSEVKAFLEESIKKFPDVEFFYEQHCNVLAFMNQPEAVFAESSKALQKFPGNLFLLYHKADKSKGAEQSSDCIIKYFNEFLAVAPPDHYNVPDAYYSIGYTLFNRNCSEYSLTREESITSEVVKYYNMGKEAEKLQLPSYLPYDDSPSKRTLDGLLVLKNLAEPVASSQETDLLVKLTDPSRVETIISFRQTAIDVNKGLFELRSSCDIAVHTEIARSQKLKREASSLQEKFKSITFREMQSAKSRVYEGRVIKLTSVEDVIIGRHYVLLLGEDKNEDILRIGINLINQKDIQEKLGFGCRFSVMNPNMRRSPVDGKLAMVVDDENSLFIHASERQLARCRFCGKLEASKSCGRCKKANYCSKDCQVKDWRILKHKLICN